MENVDVSHIFDVSYVSKSDVESESLVFYLLLLKWTEKDIEFQIYFEDAMEVSRGTQDDELMIGIKKRQYFISASSGEMVRTENSDFGMSIPTQVPEEIDSDEMVDAIAS